MISVCWMNLFEEEAVSLPSGIMQSGCVLDQSLKLEVGGLNLGVLGSRIAHNITIARQRHFG